MNYIVPVLAMLGLLLGGCTISANPIADVRALFSGTGTGGIVARDMEAAKFNFDQAIKVGALAPDDPGAGCLAAVLQDLGMNAPSYTPQRAGVLSEGAILYIRAQQLKRLQGGLGGELPVACKALIGQFAIDGARGARQLLLP